MGCRDECVGDQAAVGLNSRTAWARDRLAARRLADFEPSEGCEMPKSPARATGLRTLLLFALVVFPSAAGRAATVDALFDPSPNGHVAAIAVQPDGRVVIGGTFSRVTGVPRAYLARLLPDGTLDTSFTPSLNGAVSSIVALPDGRVLVGGAFTVVDGTAHGSLARLNQDGSLDAVFAPKVAGGGVSELALLADGDIVAAGDFTSVASVARLRLARFRPDGRFVPFFNPDLSGVTQVTALGAAPNGDVFVGGYTLVRGFVRVAFLRRLTASGSDDSGFNPPVQPDAEPTTLVVLPDGTLLVGLSGFFQSLARVMPDGTTFARPLGNISPSGGAGAVAAIVAHADGRVTYGGQFRDIEYGPTPHRNVARFATSGQVESSYVVATDGPVGAMALQADGALLIAGSFALVNGVPRANLARVLDSPSQPPELTAVDGLRLRWSLPPAAPVLRDAEIQWSGDGQSYSRLLALERTATGWEGLVGSLPAPARWLRVMGPDVVGGSMIASRPSAPAADPSSRTALANSYCPSPRRLRRFHGRRRVMRNGCRSRRRIEGRAARQRCARQPTPVQRPAPRRPRLRGAGSV
jgi:uncharacterized delta-60 repeat protein